MKLIDREDTIIQSASSVSYKSLSESFDRVLESEEFSSTNYNFTTASPEMAGFYNPTFPIVNGMVPQMSGGKCIY